ncbi:hypothetical protein GCM10011585_06380 [Edaphobacter dinghuensis]|uniref:Uncharacterized protein n=1 Tax=Edaphobacter dinghuensis TaxID=1560005 RepID=A0A917H4B4_9BACT|nr:hypothetical protein GCM10011585_06380 [Edaphobacter dinghuensis]
MGSGVGAREAEDLVAVADELGNEGGADEAGGSGDEDTHEVYSFLLLLSRCGVEDVRSGLGVRSFGLIVRRAAADWGGFKGKYRGLSTAACDKAARLRSR